MIVFFCHFALNDDPIQDPNYPGDSLCEQILSAVLNLLKTDVLENGKHLAQYFTLFSMYAGLGNQQKLELIKVRFDSIRFEKKDTNFAADFLFLVKCSSIIYASGR